METEQYIFFLVILYWNLWHGIRLLSLHISKFNSEKHKETERTLLPPPSRAFWSLESLFLTFTLQIKNYFKFCYRKEERSDPFNQKNLENISIDLKVVF